jgi:hypothetical protein
METLVRARAAVSAHPTAYERHRAGLRVDVVFDKFELCSLRRIRQQRQTAAKQHGDHCDLNRIDQLELKQAAATRLSPRESTIDSNRAAAGVPSG